MLCYIIFQIISLSFEVGYHNEEQGQTKQMQKEAEMPTKETVAAHVEIADKNEMHLPLHRH